MSGTAAEITPVRSVDGIQVGIGRCGPVTKAIQKAFFGLFTGGNRRQIRLVRSCQSIIIIKYIY